MNKYMPHLYVIPEDRRDEQIANGFVQHDGVDARRIQIMPPAGGWHRVLETFSDEYSSLLHTNKNAHLVLFIDFDGNPTERLQYFRERIPCQYIDRVFILGPHTTPETLKRALNASYESVGKMLAHDCASDTTKVWRHEQLQHNEYERTRLDDVIKPFLFLGQSRLEIED